VEDKEIGQEEIANSSPGNHIPKVAAIVPTYNSVQFMAACISSIEEQTGADIEIIISDNRSTDGTVEYVSKNHPDVIVVENKSNLGFSTAVNAGFLAAKDAEFIVLINPDTRLKQGCIEELAAALKSTPSAGIAAAKMMNMHNNAVIDCMGTAVTSAFGQLSVGNGRASLPGFEQKRYVPAACGGCMMIRSELFELIGGFDEDYFLCWEDMEFSLRAYRSGYRCVYASKAVIYHAATSIMGRWSKLNVYHYCRGALPTAIKLLPLKLLISLAPRILLNRLKIAALYTGGGRLVSAIKGDLSGIGLGWRMFKKRGSLPPAAPDFPMKRVLDEGDRLRKIMKYNEVVPAEREWEGEM